MICKCSIIVINDNSLWGKYVLRNADFRFGTPSRSHFLTHQVANHQENSWDIPFFLFLKFGISHLFRLSDFWDIPTYLFCNLGISQHFRPHRFCKSLGTILGISQVFVFIILQIDVPNKNQLRFKTILKPEPIPITIQNQTFDAK